MIPASRIISLSITILLLSLLSHSSAVFAAPTGIEQETWLLSPTEERRDFDTVRLLPPEQWQKGTFDLLNFAVDKGEHWIRIRLTNTKDNHEQLILLLDQPLQDYIDFWQVGTTGIESQYSTGDRRAFGSRPLDYRSFAFPVYLNSKESTELFIRIDTHDGLYEVIPLHLLTGLEYHQWVTSDSLWYGFYYGALVILLAYNLIIGFLTRERDFYLYSLYLGFFFIWNLAFRGYGQQFFWTENTWFANQIIALSSSAIFISLSFFTITFLNLKNKAPRTCIFILVLTGLQMIPVTLAMMGQYSLVFSLIIPLASLQLLSILAIAGYRAFKGSRSARIFTLAWGILIASVLIYYAQVLGALPTNSMTSNSLNIGSLIEMLVLALAMVDKINQLKRQQTNALETNLQLQQANNIKLEHLVEEKTAQLITLNKQLKQDAITDALTGLFNRRRLPRLYEKYLEQSSQQQDFIGFILLDIDHFKQVNDKFGHQVGDEVLTALAEQMNDFWRKMQADLFRFGGEEFGIICRHENPQKLIDIIYSFQETIEQKELHTSCRITISVGAVIAPAATTPALDKAIAHADQLLYDAKNSGRNLCRVLLLDE